MLETALKESQEEKQKVLLEKRQSEEKLSKFEQLDYEDIILQLKLDLKQMKTLLKCSQEEHKDTQDDSKNTRIIKMLKHQIEDIESERNTAIRQKKNIELDLIDLQDHIDQLSEAKTKIEKKYLDSAKEIVALATTYKENEDELEDIMRKYKTSVAAVSSQQVIMQNQSSAIIELEKEKIKLVESVTELSKNIEALEEDSKNCGKQKALEVKIKDLEYQLELETAGRQRSEIINERLKTKLENSESDTTVMKQANIAKEEVNRKLERQLKELKEEFITMQIQEMDMSEKKTILEKKVEIHDAEMEMLKSKLELAHQRIEGLHANLLSDSDSECSILPCVEEPEDDFDVFLQNHRKRMKEQKEEETRIRENLKDDKQI